MGKHLVEGMQYGNFKDGAIIALLAIAMVFIILLLIIVLTDLITKLVGKENELVTSEGPKNIANNNASRLNENDEDAMVACLIASIDYRNETGKHIEVIGVREVK